MGAQPAVGGDKPAAGQALRDTGTGDRNGDPLALGVGRASGKPITLVTFDVNISVPINQHESIEYLLGGRGRRHNISTSPRGYLINTRASC